MRETISNTLAVAEGSLGIYDIYKLVDFSYLYFIRSSALPRYRYSLDGEFNGPWALIKGSSDGIGRGFAKNFANRDGVKAELSRQWPERQIRTLVNDAQDCDEATFAKLVSTLERLCIMVLVNNVVQQNRTGKEVDTLVDINARFTTQLTWAILPTLLKNSPSLILNTGSVTLEMLSAYVTVYSGTKPYIRAWIRSSTAEMAAERNDVELLGINIRAIENQTEKRTGFFIPTSRVMAGAALDAVGGGRVFVATFWPHALQLVGVGLLPGWVQERILVRISKERREAQGEKE